MVISDEEFVLLRGLINSESGINTARLKKEIIVSRLSRRLRELCLESFSDYYRIAANSREELAELINLISTNTTQFFREPQQFEFLGAVALPEFLDNASGAGKLKIWSAGCSTGEEPYSIAMTIRDTFDRLKVCRQWDVKMLASDISTRALRKAEEGIYGEDAVSSLDSDVLRRHFLTGVGKNHGSFRIKQHLKEMMIFRRINLTVGAYPIKGLFDMIFCRNVIIYFDRDTQDRVINKLLNYLKPGGYLFCGHSESHVGMRDVLRVVRPCVYRKPFDEDAYGAQYAAK